MTRIVLLALLLAIMVFSGCRGGTWYELTFPWRKAKHCENQHSVNTIVTEACPYSGRVSILCRPGYYSSPNPERHRTRVDVNAWLKAEPQSIIFSETVWIDANRLEVIDRMGDDSGTKILLKDVIDGALYEITLRYDPATKTLKIAKMSENLKNK